MSGNFKQRFGLIGVPMLAAAVWTLCDLDPANPNVTRMAAVAVLMAGWWITEAIPIPATALLPVALFPLLGVMKGREVAGAYFNHVIFLFIGGFIMALAMQRWNLHRRIALRILLLIGAGPRRIVLGFMVATAFLSMWISNTATTMMMVPIALAVIIKLKESTEGVGMNRFSTGLLISIAYAASIGGIATLIGTPPNLSFTRIFNIYFPNAPEISFAGWFMFGLPCSLVFLLIAWLLITSFFIKRSEVGATDAGLFKQELKRLGSMSFEEKIVMALFVLMTLLWLFRKSIDIGGLTIPGWSAILPEPGYIDDGTIAIVIALLMFVIPARTTRGQRLMNWETAKKLHWGIVLLFGGGFALAGGFKASGLSVWVAAQMTSLDSVSPFYLVASTCATLTFLTELTSNTATTEMVLPLLG
ncbi:MAG: DASS family sodium-coupled anion symporter, partial [candidate division Zixibacteria bacterium]|nr:DASS family sodium-coupled anion symporter [candidate division Zixibacteria bacterium]